jgi:hypothetical protein
VRPSKPSPATGVKHEHFRLDGHSPHAVVKNRAKRRHLHKAHIDTSFARAYLIPCEHHVAVPAHEQIVFDQIPDEGAAGRRRINDTARIVKPNKRESE